MSKLHLIFVPCFFCLSACTFLSPKAEFIPENEVLKQATVNTPYRFKIDVLGGPVFRGVDRKAGSIIPADSGISVRYCQLPEEEIKDMKPMDSNNYNCVELYGTPTKPGLLKINISSGMYGHMFAPGSYFSKDYTLTVVNP